MAEEEDWGRLGKYVRNARIAAGFPTLRAWAEQLGISERTLGDLERGNGGGPNTIASVENALGWTPGDHVRVLEGGEPTGGTHAATSDEDDSDDDGPSLEQLRQTIASLREQVEMLEAQVTQAVTHRRKRTAR